MKVFDVTHRKSHALLNTNTAVVVELSIV